MVKLLSTTIWMLIWIWVFTACGKTDELLQSKVDGAIVTPFFINKIDPAASQPGQPISIHGQGLSEDLVIKIGDATVSEFISLSTELMIFSVPEQKPGLISIVAEKPAIGVKVEIPFLLAPQDGTPIVATGNSGDICQGTTALRYDGEVINGTKECNKTPDQVRSCDKEGDTNCLATNAFPTVDKEALASRVAEGQIVAGIRGTIPVRPGDCSGDAAIDCVANEQFRAAAMAGFAANDVVTGKTIAGVEGTAVIEAYATCSYDGEVGCVAQGPTFAAAVVTGIESKIKSGETIAGKNGNYGPSCANDGDGACLVDGTVFKAARMSNFTANDLKSSVQIAGVSGSIDITQLTEGNIKAGVTINGIQGKYPSLTHPLDGASATADLQSLNHNVAAGSYEWFTPQGERKTGTISDAGGTIMPGTANQVFDNSVYRGFTVAGDGNLAGGNILNTTSIFGVNGTAALEQHSTCSAGNFTGCVATASFPAVEGSLLNAANIKKGVTLGGVSGDYPSATNPLPGNVAGTDLPSLAYDVPAASYQWFKADGTRVTGTISDVGAMAPSTDDQDFHSSVYRGFTLAGDPAFIAGNIVETKTIFGLAGTADAEAHLDCAADDQVGCATTTRFKSADTNAFTGNDIITGKTIAGVSGTAIRENHIDCGGEGEGACVLTSGYVSVLLAKLIPNNIRYDFELGGQTGSYGPPCTSDGATGCVTDSDYKAAKMANFTAADVKQDTTIAGVAGSINLSNLSEGNIKNGVTIAGVEGKYPSSSYRLPNTTGNDLLSLNSDVAPGNYQWYTSAGDRITGSINDAGTITPGTSDVTYDTSVYRAFTVKGDANLVGNKILTGTSIFGVSGIAQPRPSDCNIDGGVGCVTTASFKAANMANVTAGNIRNGVIIAQVGGLYPSATHKLVGDTATVDLDSLAGTTPAGNFEWFKADGSARTGTISDAGTITPGTSDVSYTASVYRSFTVRGDPDLVPEKILLGEDIFNVTGTIVNSPEPCGIDGDTNCVATTNFPAVDKAVKLVGGNIKKDVVIAGVTGTYPSGAAPLTGSSGLTDLPSLSAGVTAGNYRWFKADGTEGTGTITAVPNSGIITPGTSDQPFNASVYSGFTVKGDADLVEGKIKKDVDLFGVVGKYPSETPFYPLAGYNAAKHLLNDGNFNIRMKSDEEFEFFDRYGQPYVNSGDTDILAENIKNEIFIFGTEGTLAEGGPLPDPQDLRVGVTVGAVTGQLKVDCRNAIGASFDYTSYPAASGNDMWDTVDDGVSPFPSTTVPAWGDKYYCSDSTWQDVTTIDGGTNDNICNTSGDECVYRDTITGTEWSEPQGTRSWTNAITHCHDLTFNNQSDWRLPTQKELLNAYLHGIYRMNSPNFALNGNYYWAATTISFSEDRAWIIDLKYGYANPNITKPNPYYTICVRP